MPWYSEKERAEAACKLLNEFAEEHGTGKRWTVEHGDMSGQWGTLLDPKTDPNPSSPSLDEDDYLALVAAGL